MGGLRYGEAGVDVQREEMALHGLLGWVKKSLTLRRRGEAGASVMDVGYFANVVEIGPNLGLAVSADGVGTKLMVAQLAGRYDTVGIDLIAMNVNDVICVGAEPITLLDYLAVEEPDPGLMEAVGRGLYAGAAEARITIPGGELAQIPDMLKGAVPGRAFDIAGFCVGTVALDKVNTGKDVRPGDVVIGFASSGIHSNGLSLARKALLEQGGLNVNSPLPECQGATVADVLLTPTKIYVRPVMDLLKMPGLRVGSLAHVTGDGFLNLSRIEAPCGFVLDALPEVPAVFKAIQKRGDVPLEEMYVAFNMGIGFTVTVSADDERKVLEVAAKHGMPAQRIGHVVADPQRRIKLPQVGLIGDAEERCYRRL